MRDEEKVEALRICEAFDFMFVDENALAADNDEWTLGNSLSDSREGAQEQYGEIEGDFSIRLHLISLGCSSRVTL